MVGLTLGTLGLFLKSVTVIVLWTHMSSGGQVRSLGPDLYVYPASALSCVFLCLFGGFFLYAMGDGYPGRGRGC